MSTLLVVISAGGGVVWLVVGRGRQRAAATRRSAGMRAQLLSDGPSEREVWRTFGRYLLSPMYKLSGNCCVDISHLDKLISNWP